MSWNRLASSSRSGALHLGEVLLRFGRRLHRVPVDGVPVDRVVLGLHADQLPLGDPASDQPGEVERLPHRDQVRAGGEHGQQLVACLVGPGRLQHRRVHAEVGGGDGGEDEPLLGGQGPGLQPEQWPRRVGLPVQPHLAGVDDEPVRRLAVDRPTLATRERQHPALRQDLARRAHRQVYRVPDPPGRHADLPMQRIRVGEAHQVRHLVGLAAEQSIQSASGRDVQGVADVQQPSVRHLDARMRPVGQPGRRKCSKHDHVAEAAAGLLQVGFEQVRRVAVRLEPLVQRAQQLRQPLPRVAPPGVDQRGPRSGHEGAVTGDHPQVQQAYTGAQLPAGHIRALGRRTDRVVKPYAGVPQGVPELLRERVDGGLVQSGVDEDKVDVRPRPKLSACQAADAGESDPLRRRAGRAVELDQRSLDRLGHRTPTIRPSRGNPRGPDRDVEALAG